MPFTKNQIIALEIEALSNDGNGVAPSKYLAALEKDPQLGLV